MKTFLNEVLHQVLLVLLLGTLGTAQAQTFSYACDFEDDADATGWVLANGDQVNHWVIDDAPNPLIGGTRSLYITDTSTNRYQYSSFHNAFVCAYKVLHLEAGIYNFSMDWNAMGGMLYGYLYDYLRVALIPSSVDITPNMEQPSRYTGNTMPAGWIALDGGSGLYNITDWQTLTEEVNVATGGDYKLTFIWANNRGSGINPPAAVDNIELRLQTCAKPLAVQATNITANGAMITWTELGGAASWMVEYGLSGFVRGTADGTRLTVSETRCGISGLEANTSYDVYLESVCSTGDISNSVKVTFRTDCGDIHLPFEEDYEGYAAEESPLCWWQRSGVCDVDEFQGYDGKSLRMANNAVLVSPKILVPINEVSLYFAAKAENVSRAGVLEVGYVTDTVRWDYVEVETIRPSDINFNIYQIDFDEVESSENGYVVFSQKGAESSYYFWWLDELQMSQLGECRSAKNIVISDVTDNSVTMSWSCYSSDATFQIVCGADTMSVVDGSMMAMMDGLQPNTVYYPMIRTICGEGDTTNWKMMGSFRTEYTCAPLLEASVDNVTTTRAVVSWCYNEIANLHTGVLLRYKASTDYAWTERVVMNNSYVMMGLLPDTKYDVQLSTLCSDDTSEVKSILFKTASGACGEVSGNGSYASSNIPIYGYQRYSYAQTIYPAEVGGRIANIQGIAYNTTNNPTTRRIAVFMGNTTKLDFMTYTDYVPVSAMTKVYEGNVDFSASGWDTIRFTTPFVNNGGNIVVAVMDSTGSGEYSNHTKFLAHPTDTRTLYKYDYNPMNIYSGGFSMMPQYYAPDIRFVGECSPSTCEAPAVAFYSATATSVTFAWMAGLNEDEWTVDYRALEDVEWTTVAALTSDTFATIENLLPGRGYELRVGAICGEDTLYGNAYGYTSCDVFAIPYYESFESGVLSPCWRIGSTLPMDQYMPRNGGGYLWIPKHNYVILPEVTEAVNTLQLCFKMSDMGAHAPLYIGVCDAKQISTMTVLDTVYVESGKVTSRLSAYEGDGMYIAMMAGNGDVYIDSLVVEPLPPCPKPLQLAVTNRGGSTLSVEWTGDVTVTEWTATVVPTGEDVSLGEKLTCYETMATFYDLLPSTTYDVYVNSECSGYPSEEVMITVTTLDREPMELPYGIDFANSVDNEEWKFYSRQGLNQWAIGGGAANGTANGLYVSDDNGITNYYNVNSASVAMAYVPVYLAEEGMYLAQYDWKCGGETGEDFARMALVPAMYDWATAPMLGSDYVDGLPEGWIALDNGGMSNAEDWRNSLVKARVAKAGTYYLTVVWVNNGEMGMNPPMAVDNIDLSLITCYEPMGVEVVDITENTATVTWRSDILATNGWEVIINNDTSTTVDTFFVLTNLMSGTYYDVSVRTVCSGDDASLKVTKRFATECSDIESLPFTANFGRLENGSKPLCWTSTTGDYPQVVDGELYFYGYKPYTGIEGMVIENIISLPQVGMGYNMNNLEMQFRVRAEAASYNKIYVGVCDVAGVSATFTKVDSVSRFNGEWKDIVVDFEDYAGTGRYITLYTDFTGSTGPYSTLNMYVDNIILQEKSDCGRLVNAHIAGYTNESATISWSDTNESATYKVAVSEGDDVLAAEMIYEDIATTDYRVTGLEGSTTYKVWVAADCASINAVSGWVYAGQFTTYPDCGMVTDIRAIDIDEESATIVWNDPTIGEEATRYVVSVKMNNNLPTQDTVEDAHIFLSNLHADSNYTVIVTTLCGDLVSANNRIAFVPKARANCNEIGREATTMNMAPIKGVNKYSLSQTIYTAEELYSMGNTINGITFSRTTATVDTCKVVVYMGVTDKHEFNDAEGWADSTTMTKVYSGAWALAEGACEIDFDTPYIYSDRTKNLVIAIYDTTGTMNNSDFEYSQTDELRVIYEGSDTKKVYTTSAFSLSDQRPNIVLDATCNATTCYPVSLVLNEVTDCSIEVAWRAGNDEQAWRVEYKEEHDADWTVYAASTTAEEALIGGLVPGTDYRVRVGAICGSEVVYRTLSATTECGPMPLPFTEKFDHAYVQVDFEKDCWTVMGDGEDNPEVMEMGMNGKMLSMGGHNMVVLPRMSGELNTLQIRMRYLAENSAIYAVVGYMVDPTDVATFHGVDTIYDYNHVTGEYHTTRFGSVVEGMDRYIAIYTPHDLGVGYVDDITVEPIRSCVAPSNVRVSNIGANSAMVTWNGAATSYEVTYGKAGYEVSGEVATREVVTGSQVTLSGLMAGTSYEVRVSAICGVGDTSYGSNGVGFVTECESVATLPYAMDFELNYLPIATETGMMPNCWSVAYMENGMAQEDDKPQVVMEDDNNVLRMTKRGMVALPEMGVAVNEAYIKFSDKVKTMSSRLVVGVLEHVNEGCEATFVAIDTIVPNEVGRYNEYVVYFNHYEGTGSYIALANIDVANGDESEHYIDNIVVDQMPSCPAVTHFEALMVSRNDVVLDWVDATEPASSYEIVYQPYGGERVSVIATEHPYILNGLDELTSYEIWVRPICGVGDTGDFVYEPLSVQTAICDNPTEVTTAPNGADAMAEEYPMAGWYMKSYSQTIVDASYLVGVTNIDAIRLKETSSSNGTMNGVRVWMGLTNKDRFDHNTDWIELDSMDLVYTGNLVYENGMVNVLLNSSFAYDGSSNLVIAIHRNATVTEHGHAFEVVTDNEAKTIYAYEDLSEIDPANPGRGYLKPAHAAFKIITCGSACPKPITVEVADVTYESATINWFGYGEDYEVAIRMAGETEYMTSAMVTGDSYSFGGLTPNETYVYSLRQVCDASTSEYSEWVEGEFTTDNLSCEVPTNLTVESKTDESITLSWDATAEQNRWSIRTYNTLEDYIDTVTSNPYTLTGLTAGVTYHISVNALCATNYASGWSEEIEVTTSDCMPVGDVAVSDITAHSAKIAWVKGGEEEAWQINYGESGYGQGEGEIIDANSNPYELNGLSPATEYDLYVRAVCASDFNSIWSDKVTFRTLESSEGIDGVGSDYHFMIYPNPTSGATTISLEGMSGKVTISIVDMNGRTITSESMECGDECEKRLDVTGLAQGTYFVRVIGDHINSVRKLIVR